jgi:hypothetical protein
LPQTHHTGIPASNPKPSHDYNQLLSRNFIIHSSHNPSDNRPRSPTCAQSKPPPTPAPQLLLLRSTALSAASRFCTPSVSPSVAATILTTATRTIAPPAC